MVAAFTHASATVDGEKGGRFRLLDGNVCGEFTELVRLMCNLVHVKNNHFSRHLPLVHSRLLWWSLHVKLFLMVNSFLCLQVPDEKIVMKWRYNTWPSGW